MREPKVLCCCRLQARKGLQGTAAASFLHYLVYTLNLRPRQLWPYQVAFTHASQPLHTSEGRIINNERLEFLGDSVYNLCVTHYLFDHHPPFNEGQMSLWRNTLNSRQFMNGVAMRMEIPSMLHGSFQTSTGNTYGNALEALFGAIYLDRGLKAATRFFREMMLKKFVEPRLLLALSRQSANGPIAAYLDPKSQFYQWAQKHHRTVEVRCNWLDGATSQAEVVLDGVPICHGLGRNHKLAQRAAFQKALEEVEPECNVQSTECR